MNVEPSSSDCGRKKSAIARNDGILRHCRLIRFSMKRQICSYDMVAVPSSSYTVTDGEGDMSLCNSRCLGIWAVMLVTKPNLPESERDRSFLVTSPVGKKRSFDKLMDLAQWPLATHWANLKASG